MTWCQPKLWFKKKNIYIIYPTCCDLLGSIRWVIKSRVWRQEISNIFDVKRTHCSRNIQTRNHYDMIWNICRKLRENIHQNWNTWLGASSWDLQQFRLLPAVLGLAPCRASHPAIPLGTWSTSFGWSFSICIVKSRSFILPTSMEISCNRPLYAIVRFPSFTSEYGMSQNPCPGKQTKPLTNSRLCTSYVAIHSS